MKSLFKIIPILILSSFFITSCWEESVEPLINCVEGQTKYVECESDSSKLQMVKCENNEFKNSGECFTELVKCTDDTQCKNGEICGDFINDGTGVCIKDPSCESDSDCLNGYHCEMTYCGNDTDEYCGDNAGVCVKDPVVCDEIMCDLACENGFKVDANGCELCECVEEPTECETDADCLNGYFCALYDCAQGYDCEGGGVCVKEEVVECDEDNACPIGQTCVDNVCKEDVCLPVTCEVYCEYGFKVDANGCEICECKEAPQECLNDSDCLNGFHCELMDCSDDVDCGAGGVCVKDEVVECRTSADCEEGMVCQLVNCDDSDPSTNCGDLGGVCVPQEVPECTEDSDCGVNQHCELLIGCFVDETGELNCPQGGTCVDNEVTVDCASDADCLNGFHCEMTYCDDSNPDTYCGEDSGICVEDPSIECRTDADCTDTQACVENLCQEI